MLAIRNWVSAPSCGRFDRAHRRWRLRGSQRRRVDAGLTQHRVHAQPCDGTGDDALDRGIGLLVEHDLARVRQVGRNDHEGGDLLVAERLLPGGTVGERDNRHVLVEQVGGRSDRRGEPFGRRLDHTDLGRSLVADDHGRHHERADDDRRREQDREDEPAAAAPFEQLAASDEPDAAGAAHRAVSTVSAGSTRASGPTPSLPASATASMNSSDRRGGW